MVRATTGGVMKTYRSNLMSSFINMNASRNTVLTQRTFNSFAEDPAAAARAFRLRKSRMTVESQHNICTDIMKKYETAFSCLQSNDDVLCTKDGVYGEYMKTLTGTTLTMLNDPTGDARTQLSKVLDQMSQTLVQTMNQKYGDNFIFAGADGHNVPFEIRDDGKLYYRGVWVDAAEPNVLKDGNGLVAVDENGQIMDAAAAAGQQVYYLKMDDVKTISQAEYAELFSKTQVKMAGTTPPDDETPVAYDSEGKEIDDLENHEGDVYYWIEGEYEVDDEGNQTDKPKLIPQAEYDEAVGRLKNMKLLTDDNGIVSVDADGNPAAAGEDGGYYRIVDESQRIPKETYDAQKLEADKLAYLADEKYFVDIGLGFQEDDKGNLIESSAFNASLSGLHFLGYGVDEDGDPRNLYSLVQKMREIAGSMDGDEDWDAATWDEFDRLVSKFEAGVSNYQTEFANLAASTTKLENQQELLEDNFYNLQEQYSDLEDVDMVDAITSFIWAEYCYNAALKVGNSILSESLMDYLR